MDYIKNVLISQWIWELGAIQVWELGAIQVLHLKQRIIDL